jgi:hypothetical protein
VPGRELPASDHPIAGTTKALLGQPAVPMVSCLPSALRGAPGLEGVQRVHMTARYFLSLGNVFFSLILGAIAFGFFWLYFPDVTLQLFKWAGSLRESLISSAWSARYEVALRLFVDERQIVYMGFVLATRIVVGLLILFGSRWIGGKPAHEEFPI